MKKLIIENLFEAKLNLPQEYIDKVTQEAREAYGQRPTQQDMMEMGRLINTFLPAQRGHEEELTELGKRIIRKFYGPVIEGVDLDIKIVSPDDEEKREMAMKALEDDEDEKDPEDPEFEEIEFEGVEHDIDKRKLINNVMQGEAQNVHSMMYDMKDEVTRITGDETLLDTYMEFLALNKKFDWDDRVNLKEMIGRNPDMANMVEVKWPDSDDDEEEGEGGEDAPINPTIKARVLDLPMLIHETVKGIYELIAAGAIDPDPKRAKAVLNAADTLEDEQVDIRYGPFIARDIREYVNNVAEGVSGADKIENLREFVFGKMITLEAKEFVDLVTAMLLKKTEPQKIIREFIEEIVEEFKEYDRHQIPGYEPEEVDEPEEDPPYDVEDFDDEEDNELIRMARGEIPTDDELKPKERKLVDMSFGELNNALNDAIDDEDWERAREIQRVIDRKKGLEESLSEGFDEFNENEEDYMEDMEDDFDTDDFYDEFGGDFDVLDGVLDDAREIVREDKTAMFSIWKNELINALTVNHDMDEVEAEIFLERPDIYEKALELHSQHIIPKRAAEELVQY